MTREEAIIHIGTLRTVTKDIPKYSGKAIDEAVDMAIKALEQEPCDDAISRQAAIDAVNISNLHPGIVGALQSILAELPLVTPQQKIGRCCPNCGAKMEVKENG